MLQKNLQLLFFSILIFFVFSPFSLKKHPISFQNQDIVWDEDKYLKDITAFSLQYKDVLEQIKNDEKQSDFSSLLSSFEEKMNINSFFGSKNKLVFHPSIAFQKQLQMIVRKSNQMHKTVFSQEHFKLAFLGFLEQVSKNIYEDPVISSSEKVAFRMMHIEYLVMYDTYMDFLNFVHYTKNTIKNKDLANVQAQKTMTKVMFSSLWHVAALVEENPKIMQKENLVQEVFAIKQAHLMKKQISFLDDF